MKLKNLKIAHRLTLGFGILCVLLVIIQIVGMNTLGKVNNGTKELATKRVPNIIATGAVLADVNEVAISVRNMLLTEDAAERQKEAATITALRGKLKIALDDVSGRLTTQHGRDLHVKTLASFEQYEQALEGLRTRIAGEDMAVARDYLRDTMGPMLAQLKADVMAEQILQNDTARQTGVDADATYAWIRVTMMILTAVVLALACLTGWLITRSITQPMARALDVANTVAAGDLTSRIEVNSSDETGQLLQALKTMNESLVRTVVSVRSGTDTIGTAAAEVAAGNLDLSARTEQQASSLEETASSMEELTSTVKQNADNARQANVMAGAASQVAERGGRVIGEVVGTMNQINSSSSKISDIIGTIDGIAFQTNILALNAAVEAARAGEQGRGFAVVATEVRNLAQRSAAAAKEIKVLIGDSAEAVQAGTKLVDEAGATMHEIVESVRRVTDIMGEITAASHEQTAGIEQINQAVTQMDQVTQQNAALVEEAAAASGSMQEQAVLLAEAVSVFRVDSADQLAQQQRAPARSAPPRVALTPTRTGASAPARKVAAKAASATSAKVSESEWEEF